MLAIDREWLWDSNRPIIDLRFSHYRVDDLAFTFLGAALLA